MKERPHLGAAFHARPVCVCGGGGGTAPTDKFPAGSQGFLTVLVGFIPLFFFERSVAILAVLCNIFTSN